MLSYLSSWIPSRPAFLAPKVVDSKPELPISEPTAVIKPVVMSLCRRCHEPVDHAHAISINNRGEIYKYHVRCFNCRTCNVSLICKLRRVHDGEVHGTECHGP